MGECGRPWAGQLGEEGCEYASVSARSHTCLCAHLCVVCLRRVHCSRVLLHVCTCTHVLHACVCTHTCVDIPHVYICLYPRHMSTLWVCSVHTCVCASTYMYACRNMLGDTAGGSSWLLCVLLRFDSLPPPSLHLPQPPPHPASFLPQKAQLPVLQTASWAAVSGS